jgi:hypothetical protein
MTDYVPNEELAVDRREETVTTQHSGYEATEQVTRDYAAERRVGAFQLSRILWAGLGLLEIALLLRVLLKLIGANPDNGFTMVIYAFTLLPTAPFNGLTPTWVSGSAILEVSTLIAMAVYWLLAWIIARAIPIVMDRPSRGTFTRTTSEQTPGGAGNERTTHTTRSG